jgi:hypothetical protein
MKNFKKTRRALLRSIAIFGTVGSSFGVKAKRSHNFSTVRRAFDDPYLELVRLLKEGCEIEHDLMLQYLYSAYALKPEYLEIVGHPVPGSTSLMGVIIEEMQHLSSANRLLVELGAAPVLTRQDFPFESDIYPFPFQLAPLDSERLAKFTYCEADPVRLARVRSFTDSSVFLKEKIQAEIKNEVMATNHVGKLYDATISTLAELKDIGDPDIDYNHWFQAIGDIKADGEHGHFKFFHSLFEASHPLIKDTPNIWSLSKDDSAYPSYNVPVNPTAYEGRTNSIEDPDLRAVAWLGNLNYWSMLLLLGLSYRSDVGHETNLAKAIMLGPLHSLASDLPKKGCAVPFDPLSIGYSPGLNKERNERLTRIMLSETRDFAISIEHLMPTNFDIDIYNVLLKEIN